MRMQKRVRHWLKGTGAALIVSWRGFNVSYLDFPRLTLLIIQILHFSIVPTAVIELEKNILVAAFVLLVCASLYCNSYVSLGSNELIINKEE